MRSFITNIVVCCVIQIISGVLLPEGKMKKFCLSILSFYLFYVVVYPLGDMLKNII